MITINDFSTAQLHQLQGRKPEDVYAQYAELENSVLLLSNDPDSRSLIGMAPSAILTDSELKHAGGSLKIENILEWINDFCNHNKNVDIPDNIPCLMGYLSYDLRTQIEKVPCNNPGAQGLPDAWFIIPGIILVCEPQLKWFAYHITYTIDNKEIMPPDTLPDGMPTPASPGLDTRALQSGWNAQEHAEAVDRTRHHIIEGDIYQANIARQFTLPISGCPYPLFQAVYTANPAPYFAYINAGDHQILSSSPELLISTSKGIAETKPIKGTAKRFDNPQADAESRRSLENSAKDAAELAMIVDLMRNDLGRVCRGGSVTVHNHREVQAFTNVYHTLTTIRGTLESEVGPGDILKAVFPGGSITGCPKIRAMEIIDEIEIFRRHIYTGSIGWISPKGNMEFNIAIRTALIHKGSLSFAAGGGIVYDSDGNLEYEETTAKADTWLKQFNQFSTHKEEIMPVMYLNGSIIPEAKAHISPFDRGFLYGDGIFETMKADNGTVEFLEDHLERLQNAAQELRIPIPQTEWKNIITQLLEQNDLNDAVARVKIILTRGVQPGFGFETPNPVTLMITAVEQPARKAPECIAVYPVPRTDPIATYKTIDYLFNLQAKAWAVENNYDDAILTDAEGNILECSTSNLFIIRDKTVIKPKNEGLYLDGIMGKHFLKQKQAEGFTVEEQAIKPEDILADDKLIMTNSMIGAVEVMIES